MTQELETRARLNVTEYRKLKNTSDSLRMDANYQAYDSLSQEQRDLIDEADKELDGWDAGDHYFELNKEDDKYLRFDVYSFNDCDFSQVSFSKEELREVIREWNGRQLTKQLELVQDKENLIKNGD